MSSCQLKTALLTYHYPQNQSKTTNLGDFIQSIAARQFYPNVDMLLDRDSQSSLAEEAKAIINGWYQLDDKFHYTSKIFPKATSIHISNGKDFKSFCKTIEHWSNFGPIGCRDEQTRLLLEKHGFDAWFSGCLTTTLGLSYHRHPLSQSKTNPQVIFADISPTHPYQVNTKKLNPYLKIRRSVQSWIANRKLSSIIDDIIPSNSTIEFTNHITASGKADSVYFSLAGSLLEKYANADLVITSRIHCALPCLGIGTPVILIVKDDGDNRFPGLLPWLNHITYTRHGKIKDVRVCLKEGRVCNPDTYKPYSLKLAESCRNFMNIRS